MKDGARVEIILKLLKKNYPHAKIILKYGNPLELLVSVVLSAQCTDVMVNKVTERLFKKYTTITDYVNADPKEFEQDIKSTGFYHNKTKNILAAAKLINDKFYGKIPKTMDEMLTVPGVARKTANVVLGNAYRIVEGIAVDTHVLRLSGRLGLVEKDADPVKTEKQLMEVIPREDWFKVTYLLIDHGRAVCRAQNPDCKNCILKIICPSSRI